jgi:hypothetical protein
MKAFILETLNPTSSTRPTVTPLITNPPMSLLLFTFLTFFTIMPGGSLGVH